MFLFPIPYNGMAKNGIRTITQLYEIKIMISLNHLDKCLAFINGTYFGEFQVL